nr:uncharacterized protein LOC4326433 [Oryza sativa Japonica Group]
MDALPTRSQPSARTRARPPRPPLPLHSSPLPRATPSLPFPFLSPPHKTNAPPSPTDIPPAFFFNPWPLSSPPPENSRTRFRPVSLSILRGVAGWADRFSSISAAREHVPSWAAASAAGVRGQAAEGAAGGASGFPAARAAAGAASSGSAAPLLRVLAHGAPRVVPLPLAPPRLRVGRWPPQERGAVGKSRLVTRARMVAPAGRLAGVQVYNCYSQLPQGVSLCINCSCVCTECIVVRTQKERQLYKFVHYSLVVCTVVIFHSEVRALVNHTIRIAIVYTPAIKMPSKFSSCIYTSYISPRERIIL